MQLTDEEREHIRLTEEYRAQVRSKLAREAESLFDKLTVPVIILIATALISGLLVPWILAKVEDERRAFDLQSRLIEQIVTDDVEEQVNLSDFRFDAVDFKVKELGIALERRLLTLRSLDASELEALRAALRENAAHAASRWEESEAAINAGVNKYEVERGRNIEWVKLHYGTKAPIDSYLKAARGDYAAWLSAANELTDHLSQLFANGEAALEKCPDERTCQTIYAQHSAELLKNRDQLHDFTAWENARRKLIQYISETKPRL